MEPRQGGRFHIWHMLTREMPFCNLCASKDGTFERENCAPKRPARFRGLDLASAISSAPETITRPFLTAARIYILDKASEFDNNVSYMPGQIEQCIIV